MRTVHVVPVDDGESVTGLVSRLADDTKLLVKAEINLQKARVGERVTAYKSAAIFFTVAAVLALSGLIALLVGLILTLATLVGPGWATAIVVLVVFVIAAVLGMLGKAKLGAVGKEPAV